ncbi:hypothetical protein LTR17_025102 [Elasticomyces elasticus]|nr:hypothetical protein LTR17_025102 [Elasticomyces elasticus]
MSTGSPSRLMTLPAELLNLILEILLIDPRGITIASSAERAHNIRRRQMLYNTVTPPAITRVSRQLRAETLPIFYSNAFKLCYHRHGPYAGKRTFHGAGCWLYRMGAEQMAMVRDLRLCTPPFELMRSHLRCWTDEISYGPEACWRRRTPRIYIGQEVDPDEVVPEDELSNGCINYRLIMEEPRSLASYERGRRLLARLEELVEMRPTETSYVRSAAQQRASIKKHGKLLLRSMDSTLVLSALKVV